MSLGIAVSAQVLIQALFWCLTGHAHVYTFKCPVELWVGFPEFSVLRIDFLPEFNDVNAVWHVPKVGVLRSLRPFYSFLDEQKGMQDTIDSDQADRFFLASMKLRTK